MRKMDKATEGYWKEAQEVSVGQEKAWNNPKGRSRGEENREGKVGPKQRRGQKWV